jgi:lysophospholipid acyltransferase (LPLAT)-like uncharacterized protein
LIFPFSGRFPNDTEAGSLRFMTSDWPLKDKILLAVLPRLSRWILALLSLTIRKKILRGEMMQSIRESGKRVIVAFWHQRLIMMPYLRRNEKIAMLISQHRDGEFIARTVRLFGIESVRGSTTRGGLQAIRAMVRAMEQGFHIAITPDGPQGPRHRVQGGAIELARLTGAPILPVTYSASRRIVFRSWDRFNLPLPFSRVVYVWGDPLFVPRELSKEALEEKRLQLEQRLKAITQEADQIFGHRDE